MPLAGVNRSQRALAHYRWAGRYADAGEPLKSLVHMERAVDYTMGPGTRFGVGLQASTIEEEVTTVMTAHFLTEFSRRDGKDLPLVLLHISVSSTGHINPKVHLTYKLKTAERNWAHFPDQPWLSLQSIAGALNELAVEMSLTAEHSVLLQMCMGKAYGSIMAQMGEEMDESSSLIEQMRKEIAQMRGIVK